MSKLKAKVTDPGASPRIEDDLSSILDSAADGVEKVRFRLNWRVSRQENIADRLKKAAIELRSLRWEVAEIFRDDHAAQEHRHENEKMPEEDAP